MISAHESKNPGAKMVYTSQSVKEDRLKQLFGQKGTVTDCALKYTKDGVFRKFAFIGFQNEAEAEAAVKFFDQTFVNTSRIQVAIAGDLGENYKNRPWSKHSKVETGQATSKNSKLPKAKKSYENELLKDLENNVDFQEFVEVHKSRSNKSTWANDNVLPSSSIEIESSVSNSEAAEKVEKSSRSEEPKQKLSDKEYLKSKMSTDLILSDDDDDEGETNVGVAGDGKADEGNKKPLKYMVRMKGLPTTVKESQIQEFFKPIALTGIHLSRNRQAGRLATVEFESEKDQELALRRNKNYIGTKKIFLHKFNEVIAEACSREKVRPWELKREDVDETNISESGQLFVRNLAYCCTEEDLKVAFEKYGPAEVFLPVDRLTKKIKGFAVITYTSPEDAVKAYAALDGTVFQGRMLHLLPGKTKAEKVEITDDMSYKKKKELLQKANASSAHNWSTLFVGANAVADIMAEKYGKSKEEIVTQTGKKDSLGVRMALGETQIVAEIRQFLIDNGVSLDAFSQPSAARSKSVILVKNLPAGTSADELRELFERYGTLGRVLLPPGGLTAIIEYIDATESRAGFRALAYTKFKHIPLYLEWAPVDALASTPARSTQEGSDAADSVDKQEEDRLKGDDDADDGTYAEGCTLFVKNINFDTDEAKLKQLFEKVGKVRSVSVARKSDRSRPGQLLSMGYGFVEYKTPKSAKEAMKVLQHAKLDDRQLELKLSNRVTANSSSERTKKSSSKQDNSTKILVRNVPFEAKTSEIRQLFSVFGELKTVRIPKKLSGTGTHRGFAFVDFLTKEDAKRAFEALCHSTHLYGRRLVLEWADTESESIETLRRKTAEHFVEDGYNLKRLKKSILLDELYESGATVLNTCQRRDCI